MEGEERVEGGRERGRTSYDPLRLTGRKTSSISPSFFNSYSRAGSAGKERKNALRFATNVHDTGSCQQLECIEICHECA